MSALAAALWQWFNLSSLLICLNLGGEDEMTRSECIVFILSGGILITNILQIQSIFINQTVNQLQFYIGILIKQWTVDYLQKKTRINVYSYSNNVYKWEKLGIRDFFYFRNLRYFTTMHGSSTKNVYIEVNK